MPRKASATRRRKEPRLSIRLSAPEKQILTQAARARRTNVSQFVLRAGLDAACAVLADQTEFRLSPAEWEAFCKRLGGPAKVVPVLRDLFSESEPAGADQRKRTQSRSASWPAEFTKSLSQVSGALQGASDEQIEQEIAKYRRARRAKKN
jgi:uncharacterized protein (DUF1778 family)